MVPLDESQQGTLPSRMEKGKLSPLDWRAPCGVELTWREAGVAGILCQEPPEEVPGLPLPVR